ncbi:MAG: FeoA family protein [Aquificota bacterium]|nr:FeoA family protein [Aquificota bacterium]
MDLRSVDLGQEFTVKSLKARDLPLVRKLTAMGLREGKKARVLLKNGRVILLRLDNSRLIIDRDLAGYIEVA